MLAVASELLQELRQLPSSKALSALGGEELPEPVAGALGAHLQREIQEARRAFDRRKI